MWNSPKGTSFLRGSDTLRIGEIAILLGDDPERRPIDSQEHADTGSSVWDGAVALAKATVFFTTQFAKCQQSLLQLQLHAGFSLEFILLAIFKNAKQ